MEDNLCLYCGLELNHKGNCKNCEYNTSLDLNSQEEY